MEDSFKGEKEMKRTIAWHQGFSNYGNLHFSIKKAQKMKYTHNLKASQLQLELSNEYDEEPLWIDEILVSDNQDFSEAVRMTYQGRKRFSIEPFSRLVTDVIAFELAPQEPIYLKMIGKNPKGTLNSLGASLDHRLLEILDEPDEISQNFYFGVTTIWGYCDKNVPTLAFFGDSLTNQGYFTNQISKGLFARYPGQVTTFNAGISGNRLLLAGTSDSEWNASFGPAGVTRFYEDVLKYQPDWVLSMSGINDLFHPGAGSPLSDLPTANQLLAGMEDVFECCQKANCSLIPMTITPFKGAENRNLYAWNREKEEIRQAVNQQIMQKKSAIDIASFVTSPTDPAVLTESVDSGDHLHFSKQGGEIIGEYLLGQLLNQDILDK